MLMDSCCWDWGTHTPDNSSDQGGGLVSGPDGAHTCESATNGRATERKECEDREERIQRVTIVHAPIWNLVFRVRTCGCRLGGDASPYAPNIDIAWDALCRLHCFDDLASQLDMNVTKPEEGYSPAEDEYFDQYGGHLAYALFIGGHAVVYRSIDVGKLLPMERLPEAGAALEKAWGNQAHQAALLRWQEDYNRFYIEWRQQHGQQHDEWIRELRKPKVCKRRGSFS